MSSTYLATLRGNCLEWREAAPEELDEGEALEVSVTVLSQALGKGEQQAQGEQMAAALAELAAHAAEGLAREIPDPAMWQRELRSDRELPNREA